MRTISIYLRMSEHTTTEVTAQNRPKSQRSYIIRNQPVTLRIGIFRHEAAVAIMSKAELEAEGWKTWLLNISKNHTLSYPVYIQPDYNYEVKPITVSEEGVISVVLNTTDTEESSKAIKGMPGDMWEAELTGFAEDDTALETPLAILQWPIGYINRVADENTDAPGLLESTYYTKEQVNELLRQIAPEGTWGHIIGNITDQEDLIALLEEKANKATTLAGYGITDAYTKTEIDAKVASVYRYKGSVNSYADLPVSGMEIGDVYNVVNADEEHGIKAGDNVAWNGENWDVLAGEIDLSGYIQKAEKGEPNGVAILDENGKVPMSQMPVLHLDALPTTSTSGSVGQLAVYHDSATNKDHLYHLCFVSEGESATLYHWEECVLVSMGNVAGGYPVLDENGLVSASQLPLVKTGAEGNAAGVVKLNASYGGIGWNGADKGYLKLTIASNTAIDSRSPIANIINPSNLDYAVRSVLPLRTEIPVATSDYSLVDSSATTNNHSHVYSHAPATAPTYRLPQVNANSIKFGSVWYTRQPSSDGASSYAWSITGTTRYTASSFPRINDILYSNTALTSEVGTVADVMSVSHYIELTVDFTAVQTYSFFDHAGEPIVPLFTPAIAAGDVYTFKMEYSAIKAAWLIYPQKQGAVADDFVMRGEVGAANGVAGLDANALVPKANLPVVGGEINPIKIVGYGYGNDPLVIGQFGIGYNGGAHFQSFNFDGGIAAVTCDASYRSIAIGYFNSAGGTSNVGQIAAGKYGVQNNGARYTGYGTNASNRKNIEELSWNGDLYIAGGHQQGITVIPSATTAYTLAEGVQHHTPEAASVYTLPTVTDATRTHECILTIKFSSTVLTYEFQDSAGNTLIPLPLNGDIEDGSVVTFYCRYESLLSQWVIMPVMVGKEAQA